MNTGESYSGSKEDFQKSKNYGIKRAQDATRELEKFHRINKFANTVLDAPEKINGTWM